MAECIHNYGLLDILYSANFKRINQSFQTSPLPLQVGHVCNVVPGSALLPLHRPHTSCVWMRRSLSPPCTASMNDRFIITFLK